MVYIAKDMANRVSPGFKTLTIVLLATLLPGCSDGNGRRNVRPDNEQGQTVADPGQAVAPALSFSASPDSVGAGGTSTLSWSSSNADSCEASGGWSGPRSRSGTATVGPINSDTDFRLSCAGAGGGVSRQVTVSINSGTGPDVTLRAEPQQVAFNRSATLSWSVQSATSCEASGAWSGNRPLSGSFGTGALRRSTSYTLSCEGPDGNALASVTVEVLDKTLRWRAPSQNVDGTPLTDLAGYVVYWGKKSRNYSGSHAINNPAVTKWEAKIASGRYFFALTALDAEGNESGYSNEVQKTIP